MTAYKNIVSMLAGISLLIVPAVATRAAEGGAATQARCAGCHNLDDPAALAGKEWDKRLDQMRRFDSLTEADRQDLFTFMREHTHKAESVVAMGKEERFFEQKCGLCHAPARIFMLPTTAEDRRHIVTRMREHWEGGESWISDADAKRILAFVEKSIAEKAPLPRHEVEGGDKDVFRTRCVGCHNMDRIFEKIAANGGNSQTWMHIVERMRAKQPEWISEDEARRIVEYITSKSSKAN